MRIFKYKNYEDYLEAQTEANVRKIRNVWVKESTISRIAKIAPFTTSVLCHGTRNAAEQKYFRKYFPAAEIIGTEISHTAKNFPMTVQHDFHEIREEWIGRFDIVYSNSFDHSYDPKKCLTAWAGQLSNSGSVFLELMTRDDNRSKRSDPLEIKEQEFLKLVNDMELKVSESFTVEDKNSKVFRIKK